MTDTRTFVTAVSCQEPHEVVLGRALACRAPGRHGEGSFLASLAPHLSDVAHTGASSRIDSRNCLFELDIQQGFDAEHSHALQPLKGWHIIINQRAVCHPCHNYDSKHLFVPIQHS